LQLSELAPEVLFTLISLAANSVLLTFYFSGVLSVPGSKHHPYKDAFLVSFPGSAAGAAFSLAVPALPGIIPHLDVAMSLVGITWILLLHYRYEASWLEAVLATIVGLILYAITLALTSGFFMLWMAGA
jgi:hypothetical protein